MVSSHKGRPGGSHDTMSLPEHIQTKLQQQNLKNGCQWPGRVQNPLFSEKQNDDELGLEEIRN